MGADKLLVRPTPHPQHADCRLLCFPWAGGGAAYFISWVKKFLPGVEVVAVRLPGRECRFKEPCYTSLEEAVREITDAVGQTLNDKPIATFGHSLGALLSFAVAEKLQEQYSTSPVHMFVSGMSAPHSAQVQEKDKVSSRTDEEFMAYVKSLGGTPNEVLQNEELMALVLPMLRADYSVYEQFFYKLPSTKPLICPIHVFDGIDDRKHDLEGWRDLTSGDTQITMLPGGHFYLKEAANQAKLTAQISECLHNVVRLTDQPV